VRAAPSYRCDTSGCSEANRDPLRNVCADSPVVNSAGTKGGGGGSVRASLASSSLASRAQREQQSFLSVNRPHSGHGLVFTTPKLLKVANPGGEEAIGRQVSQQRIRVDRNISCQPQTSVISSGSMTPLPLTSVPQSGKNDSLNAFQVASSISPFATSPLSVWNACTAYII
jgi:hypothetical protein